MISNSSTNHRQRFSRSILVYLGLFILFISACILPGSVQPTPIVITATVPVSTETPPLATPITPTSPNNASCTVLQDLNLRSGPGTAYNPPLAQLDAGTELIPIGFEPQGVPGGPWVQVQVESINQTGWVSAGSQFVSCNLELTILPQVDVPPPPRGVPPRIGTGGVEGDNISAFRFSFDYNPDYFVRMYVFRSDDPDEVFSTDKDGRGITSVEFIVTKGNVEYYRRTEVNPGYCIFAGGEPDCNPWIFENEQNKWVAGGNAVEEGNYLLTVIVTANDDTEGRWFIDFNIDLP